MIMFIQFDSYQIAVKSGEVILGEIHWSSKSWHGRYMISTTDNYIYEIKMDQKLKDMYKQHKQL